MNTDRLLKYIDDPDFLVTLEDSGIIESEYVENGVNYGITDDGLKLLELLRELAKEQS